MSKLALFEWLVILAAGAVSALGVPPSALLGWPVTAVLAALVVATVIFQRGEGRAGRFEAAVAFPAVVLFSSSDPWLACFVVFAGLVIGGVFSRHREGSGARVVLSRAAQATLAYGFGAYLFREFAKGRTEAASAVIGSIILAIGFLAVVLALASIRRSLQGVDYRTGLVRDLLRDLRSIVLLSPIVAAEILVWPRYGAGGLVVAFLTVAFVAFALRGKAEAEDQATQLSRRTRELSTLSKGSLELFSAEGNEATAARLCRLLDSIVATRACAVVLWAPELDEGGTVFRFGNCQPSDQTILKWLEAVGYDHSAPRKPLLTGPGDVTFRLSESPAWQLLGGLQTTEVIYGVVIVESESADLSSPDTIDLLNLVLTQCGLSLQDQFLKSEMLEKNVQLERQAETMSSILRVSGSLLGTVDAARIVETVGAAIERTEGVGHVVVAPYDEKTDEYVQVARGRAEDELAPPQGPDAEGSAACLRIPASRIAELSAEQARVSSSYFYSLTDLGRREAALLFGRQIAGRLDDETDILVVPLSDQSSPVGVLLMTIATEDRRAPLDRVQTIEIFANQAVTALRSAKQYEAIHRLTIIDGLTPAYNHRYFQETLQREVHRHERRENARFSLAMLDIDNFKRINDTYGHQAGDQILKRLVQLLLENVRDADTVARYGGEEFALILPEQGLEGALEVAERIRGLLEGGSLPIGQGDTEVRVTVSIGIAVFPDDGAGASSLVARADAALYQAKRTGKNRVCVASASAPAAAGSQPGS
ncbi:MAG: GGDEF domain-containing protein [Minisyncoccota bacterium]